MIFETCEPYTCSGLDEHALEAWERDGVLRIAGLVPQERIAYARKRITEMLGAEPESPEAWANLQSSLLKSLGRDKKCVFLEADPVKAILDTLIGKGWTRPKSGGTWFTNPPTHPEGREFSGPALAPRGRWHWDGRPDQYDGASGLWAFTPVTELPPHSGGTWMAAGSARTLADFFRRLPPERQGKPTKQVKPWFSEAHDWFAILNSREPLNQAGRPDEVIRLMNVTGTLGDIIFMKPLTIHSSPEYVGPGPRVCHVIGAGPSA